MRVRVAGAQLYVCTRMYVCLRVCLYISGVSTAVIGEHTHTHTHTHTYVSIRTHIHAHTHTHAGTCQFVDNGMHVMSVPIDSKVRASCHTYKWVMART